MAGPFQPSAVRGQHAASSATAVELPGTNLFSETVGHPRVLWRADVSAHLCMERHVMSTSPWMIGENEKRVKNEVGLVAIRFHTAG